MAHLFHQPRALALSNLATPVVADAYFYDAQTSTPRVTYTTAALSVAHPVPVPTNSVGVFPPIYLDPAGGPYKVDIKNHLTGVSLSRYPIDNLEAEELPSAQSLGQIFNDIRPAEEAAGLTEDDLDFRYSYLNGLRYGMVPDGDAGTGDGTDNSPAFNIGMDVCRQHFTIHKSGCAFYVPAGDYKFLTGCAVPKATRVTGSNMWTIIFCPNAFAEMAGLLKYDDTGGPPAQLDNIAVIAQSGGAGGCGIVVTSNGTIVEQTWCGGFTGAGSVNVLFSTTDFFYSSSVSEIGLYCLKIGDNGTSGNITDVQLYNASAAGSIAANSASIENGRVCFSNVRATDCVQDGFVDSNAKGVSYDNCHTIATNNGFNTVSGFNTGSSTDIKHSNCAARVTGTASVAGLGFKKASSSKVENIGCQAIGFLDGVQVTSCDGASVNGGSYTSNTRRGVYTSAGDNVTVNGVLATDNGESGIYDENSDANCNHAIIGNTAQNNGSYGIYSNLTGNGYTNIVGNTARLNTTKNISLNGSVARTGFAGNIPDFYDSVIPSVASATALTLSAVPYGVPVDVVSVTGTTTITSIVATDNFLRRVTLHFVAACTVTDGSNLKLASSFTSTAGSTLTLYCNGTDFFEVSRAVV